VTGTTNLKMSAEQTDLVPLDNGKTEFESNPESYWGARIRKFAQNTQDEDGLEKFKDAITNDAVAWGIFAALLMTVGFAGVLLSNGDWNEDNEHNEAVNYAYIAFEYICAVASFAAVIIGTLKYSYFNNLAPAQMDKAINASRHWNIAILVYFACFCQMIASVLAGYLLFGVPTMVICIVITIICGIVIGVALLNQKKSYQDLGMFHIANN